MALKHTGIVTDPLDPMTGHKKVERQGEWCQFISDSEEKKKK